MCPSPPLPLPLASIDACSTDEEVILFLGGRKDGDPLPSNVITEVNPFSVEPWDSPENMWYLYRPEDSQYHIRGSIIKVTDIGYWRTLNDLRIVTATPTVGRKTAREFYLGKAFFGDRSGWVMHEYQAERKPHLGTHKDHSSLCRVFLQNEPRSNIGEQDTRVNAYNDVDKYLKSKLPSLVEQEKCNPSGNHATNFQVFVEGEHSRPSSSERSPHDLVAYNSVEDMPATYDFSKGDYLELNDLYGSETSSSSSDNSSLMSGNLEEYFDPDALLKDIGYESGLNKEEEHAECRFYVSTSVKSNQVVIKPSSPGLVHSNNNHLLLEETVSADSVPEKRQALGPVLSASAAVVLHNGNTSTSGTSKGKQTNQSPCQEGVRTPQGVGSRSAGRMAKLGKKYLCFGSFRSW